ncbi:hypothetical protein APS_0231 [Acetobacter pasteurianus subsp. pasteurianus LMG 1262 = NBRC 106471]|nr:hypothetical protein APS_0231 [Acetobacter pasteurianus subsp. pasteurianus LMG 1262 = NBRC 106471]
MHCSWHKALNWNAEKADIKKRGARRHPFLFSENRKQAD